MRILSELLSRPTLLVGLLAGTLAGLPGCGGCTPDVPPGEVVIRTDCGADTDNDGICDEQEIELGTNPAEADSDDDGIDDASEVRQGTDPNNPDTDGDGIPDGTEVELGTDPTTSDSACVDNGVQASVGEVIPVDIIIAIDSSGSMDEEIEAVQDNINNNFADIIGASEIDYQVTLLGDYPPADRNSICIEEPLSGDDCQDPLPDVPTPGARFVHYDTKVGSHDAFDVLVDSFDRPDPHGLLPDGWEGRLRVGALKVFVVITDDDPNRQFSRFDRDLLAIAPEQFGTEDDRNYIWHSIIGMEENDPANAPWLPENGVQNQRCSPGSESSAVGYQELSILTGGLRFPLCDNASFDVVFQEIAAGVIDEVLLPCGLSIPSPPPGEEIDLNAVALVFTPTNAPVQTLRRVADAGSCGGDDSFYLDGDIVTLCADTCSVVQADPEGQLDMYAACRPLDVVVDAGPQICESCADCGGQACMEGVCGECEITSDCCAGLVCISGTCIPAGG